ncbi:MAG TPA: outer membrane protein assembly factor BamD [Verrucomicrobiae bacterium]|nr:outer membrane protein assembly factor BamD [Verrucomicrobiae bacterium]
MRHRVPRIALALALAAAALFAPACGRKNLDKVPKDREASLTPQQLYEKGTELSRRGHYYRARQILEKVLSRANVGPEILGNTNLAIADAYYYDGGIINVAEALSRYTSFLTFYPTHPRADYAQYQLGLSYLRQALTPDKDQATTRQALDAFRKVETGFPTSPFVALAREKADACRQRLAESAVRIGRFYAKRKAYDGATSRYRTVLADYPKYSHADQVTFLLAEALRGARKEDEARLYFQKVIDGYPNSRYRAQAVAALAKRETEEKTAETPREKKSSSVETDRPVASGGR